MAKLVEIGALLSAFIVCVACATAGSRTLFAMGREGVLPPWVARPHPRVKRPVTGTLTVVAVATVLAVIVGYGFTNDDLGQPFTVYALMATIGTLAVLLVYIGLCIRALPSFRRESRRVHPLTRALIPTA